ncbi:MAG: DUF5119 domain-containing protein [Bacteroides sp.]|nr:DUF5119 domain-containing protein [Bacteroides sp.]
MRNSILFIAVGCLFLFLSSCKSDEIPCCEGYNLTLVNHWTDLGEGRDKPTHMCALVYDTETSDYTRLSLHADGGKVSADAQQNNLLLYNIREGESITFQSLNEFAKAEARLIPYEENNELYIAEPYLLYGESFANQTFSETSATLHCTPVALTHLIRFEIRTAGEGVEDIIGCAGWLSGLSSRVNLSTKQKDSKGYPVRFTTTQTTTNYFKELYHFGYSDKNVLELVFDFPDDETKRVEMDLTDTLSSMGRKELTCRLTVFFSESGVHVEIRDIIIEPYQPGNNEFVDLP